VVARSNPHAAVLDGALVVLAREGGGTMKMPRFNATDLAIFAACYAASLARHPGATDNSAHESALEDALWDVRCFRKALRDREDDS
jgi:hypothetical protein